MAEIHNQLRRGGWSKALKNALGDSQGESGIERYGETLTPVIDIWSQPEWSFLRNETLFSARIVRAADAANVSIIGLSLPLASKFIVIVEGITARNSVAGGNLVLSMLDRATAAALAGFGLGNPPFFRDQRAHATIGAQFAPVETWSAASGAVTINGTMEDKNYVDTNDRDFKCLPLIVRPGGTVFLQGLAVNQQIVGTFFGRVRTALPTELVSF